jgi:phasin
MGAQNLSKPAWRVTQCDLRIVRPRACLRAVAVFALPSFARHLGEPNMAKDPFEQFAIPDQLRAFAEQSVAQARKAFEGFIDAANQAVGQMQDRAEAAHGGASEIAQKSMHYAEQNVAATFDFAQKLMRAKDAAEVMGLQSEYLGRQMQALSAQVQELGQSAAKMVVDSTTPKS